MFACGFLGANGVRAAVVVAPPSFVDTDAVDGRTIRGRLHDVVCGPTDVVVRDDTVQLDAKVRGGELVGLEMPLEVLGLPGGAAGHADEDAQLWMDRSVDRLSEGRDDELRVRAEDCR